MVNKLLIVVLLLSGCAHYTEMKDVYIDNTTVNNYVGNPCGFYLGDRCLYIKPNYRDPENPYKQK